MLVFSPLGNNAVRIVGADKPLNVFPKSAKAGDVNLLPSPQENAEEGVISWPGEYDIAGITVRGIGQEEGQKVSYAVEIDGMRCAFPNSPLAEWAEADIERLGDVHVLVLPAQDAKLAQKLLDEIDPRIVIIVPDSEGKMDNEVLKLAGAVGKDHVTEYKMKGTPAEGREIVVFSV